MKRSCNCLIERAASTPEKVNMSGWLAKRTARMELILRPPSLSILGGGMMKHDETVKNWGQTWEIHHWHLLNSIDTGKPRHFGKQLPWSSPCATEVSTSNSPQPIPGLQLLKIQTHFHSRRLFPSANPFLQKKTKKATHTTPAKHKESKARGPLIGWGCDGCDSGNMGDCYNPVDRWISLRYFDRNGWTSSERMVKKSKTQNLIWDGVKRSYLKFILDFAHGLGLKHAAAVTKLLIHFHPKSAVSATYQVQCIPSSRCQCFLLQRAGPNLWYLCF